MKKYIAPELEISKFEAVDIVTASGEVEAVTLSDDGTNTIAGGEYSGRDLKWIQ